MKRVGALLMLLAWVPVALSFYVPSGSTRYDLFVLAHVMTIGGYLLIAVTDSRSRAPANVPLLILVLLAESALAVMGPVVMAAATAM